LGNVKGKGRTEREWRWHDKGRGKRGDGKDHSEVGFLDVEVGDLEVWRMRLFM
jgi:hypothetical protein